MNIELKIDTSYQDSFYILSANTERICEVFSKEVGFSDSYNCSLFNRNFFLAIFTNPKRLDYNNSHHCSDYK